MAGPAMAIQIRKRNQRSWQKLTQPLKLNARRRADCVVREARCAAKPGAIRAALEQAVAAEIDRMRALHENEDAVRAFQAATEIHIALCGTDQAEHTDQAEQ
jgi:DNA-binding FadR family transcriptional regulator